MTAEVGIQSSPLSSLFGPRRGKDVLDNGTSFSDFALRLSSYKNFPNKHIDSKKLAAAGFRYIGNSDIVECVECGVKGRNWKEHDEPMDDHRKWNANCPFVRRAASSGGGGRTTEHDNVRSGRDICGNLGVEILPETKKKQQEANLEKLGIQKTKGPSHPDQIIFEKRLSTFANWPKSMKQKPCELAAAGFYYLGLGDQTLCFYCGGGLKDWEEEDDPWEQHALWFPKCNYLLLKKSPAYVEKIQKKHSKHTEQEEVEETASCSKNTKETATSTVSEEKHSERKEDESTALCKICYKNELGVVFLPCGHMVACIDCASALKECAVCRQNIQATVRAFLS